MNLFDLLYTISLSFIFTSKLFITPLIWKHYQTYFLKNIISFYDVLVQTTKDERTHQKVKKNQQHVQQREQQHRQRCIFEYMYDEKELEIFGWLDRLSLGEWSEQIRRENCWIPSAENVNERRGRMLFFAFVLLGKN